MTSVAEIDNLDKSGSPLNPDSAGETTLDDVDVTVESDGVGWCVLVGVASQAVLVDTFKVGDMAVLSDSQGTHMSPAPTPAKPAVVSECMVTCTQSELGCVLVGCDVTVRVSGTSTVMFASPYVRVRLLWIRTRSRMAKIVTAMPTSSPPMTPPTIVPALVLDLEPLFPFPFPLPLPFPAFPAFPVFPLTAPWEMVWLATLQDRRGSERKYLDGSLNINLREGEVGEYATEGRAGEPS